MNPYLEKIKFMDETFIFQSIHLFFRLPVLFNLHLPQKVLEWMQEWHFEYLEFCWEKNMEKQQFEK